MNNYHIFQDRKKCIGCMACEVHCKTWNDVPIGPRLARIIAAPPKNADAPHLISYEFMPCYHCEKPKCVPACPTGAMKKRPEDGIVYIDASICDGCKDCITACPWEVPQWDPNTGKAIKCDLCMSRIDQGLKPACITKCVTHCLQFGTAEEMKNKPNFQKLRGGRVGRGKNLSYLPAP